MEHNHIVVPVVVAVDHKGVAACGTATRIEDGPPAIELVHQGSVVFGCGHVVATDGVHGGFILEVALQRALRRSVEKAVVVVVLGAAATIGGQVVAHLVGHTDVVHQGGYGVHLRRAAAAVEGIGHIVPVVGSVAEVGALGAVGVVGVGMRAVASGGMLPELHDLGRGSGHAARDYLVVIVVVLIFVLGAEVVVVGCLVPGGGHQGADTLQLRLRCRRRGGQLLPLCGHCGTLPLPGSRFHTFAHAVHPRAHMGRHAVYLECACKRIAQYGSAAVIGGYQHEVFAPAAKHIETRKRRLLLLQLGRCAGQLAVERLCYFQGRCAVHRACHCSTQSQHKGQQECNVFFHDINELVNNELVVYLSVPL